MEGWKLIGIEWDSIEIQHETTQIVASFSLNTRQYIHDIEIKPPEAPEFVVYVTSTTQRNKIIEMLEDEDWDKDPWLLLILMTAGFNYRTALEKGFVRAILNTKDYYENFAFDTLIRSNLEVYKQSGWYYYSTAYESMGTAREYFKSMFNSVKHSINCNGPKRYNLTSLEIFKWTAEKLLETGTFNNDEELKSMLEDIVTLASTKLIILSI